MSTYLKYRPAWVQLLIFGSLTLGIFVALSYLAVLFILKAFSITAAEFQSMDLANPSVLAALKAFQVFSAIGFFLVPSLVFGYLSDRKPMKYVGFRKPVPASFFFVAIGVILASFPMVAWLGQMNQHMHFPAGMESLEKAVRSAETQNDNLVERFLVMKSFPDLFRMLFMLAILPALSEELFFRGVLQRLFIQITSRPWVGIVFTAVIFSALHGQFLGFVPRVVLGIVLGALYWYSGSLWPGIIAHFINNAVQIIMVYYDPKLADKDPHFEVWMIVASTFMVLAALWWMRKVSQTSYAEVFDTDDDFHIGPRDQYIA